MKFETASNGCCGGYRLWSNLAYVLGPNDTKQDEHYANYGRAQLNAEYTLDFFNFLIRILATQANVSGMGLQGLEDRIHSGRTVGNKACCDHSGPMLELSQ